MTTMAAGCFTPRLYLSPRSDDPMSLIAVIPLLAAVIPPLSNMEYRGCKTAADGGEYSGN
jgi:hypothetical protein